MRKIEFLLRGWDRVYALEDWYPPLKQAFEGVSVEQARWQPAGAVANPIWAIVDHLVYLKKHFLNTLRGGSSSYPKGLTSYDPYGRRFLNRKN